MALFFYGFAAIMLMSALMVITSRNAVHSVLWLIFTFCNASGLMILMGAEFLAMMLIIIYVGAVAILFLFVVMMLDVRTLEFNGKITSKMSAVFIMAIILLLNLLVVILIGTKALPIAADSNFSISPNVGNIYIIGRVLYTDFVIPFQICGLILFVAIITSISLTLRIRPGVKSQKIDSQLWRNKENSLVLVKNDGKLGLDDLNYDD